MTIQQILEEVQQLFPQIGETQLRIELDQIQKDFARETRLLSKETVLSNSDLTLETTKYQTLYYSLDKYVAGVKKVTVLDTTGANVSGDYSIRFESITDNPLEDIIKVGRLYFYDYNNQPITSIGTNIVVICTIQLPETISGLGDTLSIPEDFHHGLVAKLLQNHCARNKDYQGASYWSIEYKDARIKAKRLANTFSDLTPYQIQQHQL